MNRVEFEAELRRLLSAHETRTENERCVECASCQRCIDCTFCRGSVALIRSHYCIDSQRCFDCTHCRASRELLSCNHCAQCERCMQCSYLVRSVDCAACTYCFGCVGLSGKDFHILNRPYEQREYFSLTSRLTRELGVG
jgi:hypothetical protein